MRKFVSLLMILSALFLGVANFRAAEADTTDTFTITVTCNFIEINLRNTGDSADYSTWALGTVATSSTTAMTTGDGVKVVLGTTSQTIDIQSHVSNQGSAWTIASAAAANVYKMDCMGTDAAAVPTWTDATVLTTSTLDIKDVTSVSTDQYLYYRFYAPTSVITGAEQTITITVTGVAS